MSEKTDKFVFDNLPEYITPGFFLFYYLIILKMISFISISKEPELTKPCNPHLDPNKVHPQYALLLIVAVEGIQKHINLLSYLLLPPFFSLPSYTLLDEVKEVRIQNNWKGYNETAPHRAEYRLKLINGELVGEARFSITYKKFTSTVKDITIPSYVVQAFFETIMQAKFENKPCYWIRFMTDHYPYQSVSILTETSFTTIASSSQDVYPWCLITQGQKYLINSDIPYRALQHLLQHLESQRTDSINSLIKQHFHYDFYLIRR